MMELERSTSTLTSIPTSSTMSDSDVGSYRVSGDQLVDILSSGNRFSSPYVILDCRESGSHPMIRGAQKVRLPSVLYRRLNNGTLSPASICPMLNSSDCQVVIVPDSMSPNSLASKVFNILVQRQFNVAFLADDVDELAHTHPSLCNVTSPEDIVSELKLNLLSVCDGYKTNTSSQIGKEKNQPPSKLFPVQILPYLFLGNDETAKDKSQLEKYGIRYIINVTANLPNYFHDDPRFHYLRIGVDDTCSHNLAQFFPDAIAFIEKARAENASILVHCWAGISRSVTVCLAYLMHATHKTLEEAFDILLKQNGAIAPNFHFMGQLTEFERTLFPNESLFTPDSGMGSSVPSSTTSSESGCSSY
uniref:protein-tyrosine-phosphatase n=1 Tax=Acrobeloides nanus TaxID=290746 RepID=A0A914C4K5_9BILA